MAFNDVPTVATGDLWTSSNHNTYIRDNFAAGVPAIFQAAGDLAVASGLKAASRLAIGAVEGMALLVTSGLPVWVSLQSGWQIPFYDGGAVLDTGIRYDLYMTYKARIKGVALLADQSGDVVIDIWKDTYANFPPTVADTICASAKPTLSAAIKALDTTLTGWTVDVNAGDVLRINIDSCTTITRLMMTLQMERRG